MKQYIKKSALVAEIKRRIEENKAEIQRATHKHLEEYFEGYEDALVLFKEKFLDTFEVKEIGVDLGVPQGDKSVKYIIDTKTFKVKDVQEEPISNDLEEAAHSYVDTTIEHFDSEGNPCCYPAFIAGAQWQKANLWKDAQSDDLPEIDREVIALLSNGKVVYAHRPQEYWDGKNITTGEVTRYYPKRHDKGGWNIPDVKFWLDCELFEIEE